MILAYAALLLQLSAPAQPASSTAVTSSSTDAGSPAITSNNPGDKTSDTAGTRAGKSSVDPTTALRNVRLGEAPTGAAMDPGGTKDVALDLDETGQGLSNIRVPEIKQPQNNPIQEAEVPSRRTWLALALAEHAAASFDAYSTRLAVSRGAVEDDPLMRPFAHSDAIYAAAQAGPLLFDYIARKMQRSDNLTLRRFWWLPQSVSTGVSLFAGVHNIHVANSLTK
jgi:hypothetical protein